MQRQDIQEAIDKLPELTDFGVGIFGRKLSFVKRKQKTREQQEILLNSIDSCNKICAWLSSIQKIKSINRNRTSYGLKHIAEKDIGYITNGVFIAAAIHCGFDFKVIPNSANVMFNMSEKSIKEEYKRILNH